MIAEIAFEYDQDYHDGIRLCDLTHFHIDSKHGEIRFSSPKGNQTKYAVPITDEDRKAFLRYQYVIYFDKIWYVDLW